MQKKPTLNRCVILGFDEDVRVRILAEQARLAELRQNRQKKPKRKQPRRDR